MGADGASQDDRRGTPEQRKQRLDQKERTFQVRRHQCVVGGLIPFGERSVGYIACVDEEDINLSPSLRQNASDVLLALDIARVAAERHDLRAKIMRHSIQSLL